MLGIGAGAGVVAYTSGGISRIYEAEYHRAVDASVETLNQLKIPPDEKTGDELKTEIRAFRADGSPVKVEVERINSRRTQISIRTGTVGVLDKPVSHQIHENIEKNLLHFPERGEIPPDHTLGRLKKTNPRQPIKEQASSKAGAPEPIPTSDSNPDKPTPRKQPLATQGYEKRANSKYIIFFSQDSNMLQEKAMEKLGEIAAMVSEEPEAQLMITGFSDSKGSAAYKRMLSERRANTVKLYLVANGISSSRSQVSVQSTAGDLPNQGAAVEILYRDGIAVPRDLGATPSRLRPIPATPSAWP
jgi:outer membrane protein OmpA-like peptidoglycan-associated protein